MQTDEAATTTRYINMEGFMEKLPMNKKKATLLKTWRRRFFKTRDGSLYYYEVSTDVWPDSAALRDKSL